MYNYYYEVKEAIKEEILYNYTKDELKEKFENASDLQQELQDEFFVSDSITGNASGSYYCNAWKAGEALQGNWDLLLEALQEFGEDDINPIEKGEEWCDVTIRCYVLPVCLRNALKEIEEELEEEKED